jgi:hypothetical protein
MVPATCARVVVVVDRVEAGDGPALEVLVPDAYAGVDDVRGHALARVVGVGVLAVARGVGLVDAVEAPGRRVVLGGVDGELLVLHDLRDGGVGRQPLGLGLRETARGEAVDGRGVVALEGAAVFPGELRLVGLLVQQDDVAAGDGAFGAEAVDRSLRGCGGGRGARVGRAEGGEADDDGRGGGETDSGCALESCHEEGTPRHQLCGGFASG